VKNFAVLEGFQEKQGRGEAEQEAHENSRGNKQVYRTPDHVDQKLRQHHQSDKSE
jgi:hypothetical protein